MGRYDDYFPPYVPVAERREQAAKAAAKLAKKTGRTLHPVKIGELPLPNPIGARRGVPMWGKNMRQSRTVCRAGVRMSAAGR